MLKFNVVPVAFVNTRFETVAFDAANAPVEILVVANKVPVVKPVLKLTEPELKLVNTAFVLVKFVENNAPDETLVLAVESLL